MASIDTYRNSLRSPARALWSGKFSHDQYIQAMNLAISQGITQAFKEGSAECFIKLNEYTPQEQAALALFIGTQQGYVSGLADWIVNNRQSFGGKLGAIFSRLEMWVNAWREAKGQASALSCADLKKKFRLGNTKEHCKSCQGLNGRVYRNSVWVANNAVPPSHAFQCGGWVCQCKLMDTDEPITRGKFPKGLLV